MILLIPFVPVSMSTSVLLNFLIWIFSPCLLIYLTKGLPILLISPRFFFIEQIFMPFHRCVLIDFSDWFIHIFFKVIEYFHSSYFEVLVCCHSYTAFLRPTLVNCGVLVGHIVKVLVIVSLWWYLGIQVWDNYNSSATICSCVCWVFFAVLFAVSWFLLFSLVVRKVQWLWVAW